MGNCANKPLTTEGAAPPPEEKPTAESTVADRDLPVDQLKEEQKNPTSSETAGEATKEGEEEPSKTEPSEPKLEETKPIEKVDESTEETKKD